MPEFTGTLLADTLPGSIGVDTLIGLAGDDLYLVNQLGDLVVEASGGGFDTIETSVLDGLGRYDLSGLAEVEGLRSTSSLDAILIGNDAGNRIEAASAVATNDTLIGGPGHDSLFGMAGADMLDGGTGNDVLDGGAGSDTMIGGAGDDVYVIASSGDRVIELAGGGRDTIRSGVMTDLTLAWTLQVEALVYTGTGGAELRGNDLDNALTGRSGADTLLGGLGRDTLSGLGGADILIGGLGDDLYMVDASDTVTELAGGGVDGLVGTRTDLSAAGLDGVIENLFYSGAGAATLTGNGLANVIAGGAGNDSLSGGDGNDSLAGGDGADLVQGGAGDDVLAGGLIAGLAWGAPLVDLFADTLDGGEGSDTYQIGDLRDVATDSGTGGTDAVIATTDESLARHNGIEVLILADGSAARLGRGTALADVLIGSNGDNSLTGGAGNDLLAAWGLTPGASLTQDVLEGGDGNDTLVAADLTGGVQGGAVALFGGAGSDLYLLGRDGLSVGGIDASGTDTAVLFASADLSQMAGVERIVLFGAQTGLTAVDRAALSAGRDALDRLYGLLTGGADYDGAATAALDATGNAEANRILGNIAHNRLWGGGGADTIFGGAGNDSLFGGTGSDSLIGGQGDDVYDADTGDVVVEVAGGGYDILRSADLASFGAFAHVEGFVYLGSQSVLLDTGFPAAGPDYLAGGSGDDTLRGHQGNDSLWGNAGNDRLEGGDHDDSLTGGEGLDTLLGGLGDDWMDGGAGADLLDGGGNRDWISGAGGADTLLGEFAGDTLSGGAGHDLLFGGSEHDLLVGGAGRDTLDGGTINQGETGSGDILFGDEMTGGLSSADVFVLSSVSVDNGAAETFSGSGIYFYRRAVTVVDFDPGLDRLAVPGALVGDSDAVIDSTSSAALDGSFAAGDELVFFRTEMAADLVSDAASGFDALSALAVDAVIGTALAAIPVNQTQLFVLTDGESSAVFLFQSNDGNAAVTLDELYLVAVVAGQSVLGASDFFLI